MEDSGGGRYIDVRQSSEAYSFNVTSNVNALSVSIRAHSVQLNPMPRITTRAKNRRSSVEIGGQNNCIVGEVCARKQWSTKGQRKRRSKSRERRKRKRHREGKEASDLELEAQIYLAK